MKGMKGSGANTPIKSIDERSCEPSLSTGGISLLDGGQEEEMNDKQARHEKNLNSRQDLVQENMQPPGVFTIDNHGASPMTKRSGANNYTAGTCQKDAKTSGKTSKALKVSDANAFESTMKNDLAIKQSSSSSLEEPQNQVAKSKITVPRPLPGNKVIQASKDIVNLDSFSLIETVEYSLRRTLKQQTEEIVKQTELRKKQFQEEKDEILKSAQDIQTKMKQDEKSIDTYLDSLYSYERKPLRSTAIVKEIISTYKLGTPASLKMKEIDLHYDKRTKQLLQQEFLARERLRKRIKAGELQLYQRETQAKEQLQSLKQNWQQLLRITEARIRSFIQKTEFDVKSMERSAALIPTSLISRSSQNIIRAPLTTISNVLSYHLSWKSQAIFLTIQLKLCRSVLDKLIPGNYAIRCLLRDKLGGRRLNLSLRRSVLQQMLTVYYEQTHGVVPDTEAVSSSALYINTEDTALRLDESIHILLPARKYLRPSMTLSFELCYLHDEEQPYDTVVGWGSFPLLQSNLRVLDGNYKVPLLRGKINKSYTRFIQFEESINQGLDNWLCNLYFMCKPFFYTARSPTTFEIPCISSENTLNPKKVDIEVKNSKQNTEINGSTYKIHENKMEINNNYYSTTNPLENLQSISFNTIAFPYESEKFDSTASAASITKINLANENLEYSKLPSSEALQILASELRLPMAEKAAFQDYHYSVFTGSKSASTFRSYLFTIFADGIIPPYGHHFTFYFGLIAIFVPWIATIVDVILYSGTASIDFFRIANIFGATNQVASVGMLLTILLYITLMTVAIGLFYYFILRVYGEKKLRDLFRRLNGMEKEFLVPIDTTVTEQYVQHVCESAKYYLVSDNPNNCRESIQGDANSKNTATACTYITILRINPEAGTQELHRQLFRDEEGYFYSVRPKNVFVDLLEEFKSIATSETFYTNESIVLRSQANVKNMNQSLHIAQAAGSSASAADRDGAVFVQDVTPTGMGDTPNYSSYDTSPQQASLQCDNQINCSSRDTEQVEIDPSLTLEMF
ncbi:hypothetical protein IE077_004076 [Cardiosporidium cionae]|uniref:Uncharacterized protein n=1 Tax=Cardiosporidium cionae TaxID=476202 RepID=A0ABQ7J7P8_9APIC|nr:hypothetical protein IE077_004076 [Cardiosporidium cionae]|eukprot:KAF8819715.1 hypothetical protein IE077_004076 [Cardiosporidium cionae]